MVWSRERRRRGRGNGHLIDFRCFPMYDAEFENEARINGDLATCESHKVLGREKLLLVLQRETAR